MFFSSKPSKKSYVRLLYSLVSLENATPSLLVFNGPRVLLHPFLVQPLYHWQRQPDVWVPRDDSSWISGDEVLRLLHSIFVGSNVEEGEVGEERREKEIAADRMSAKHLDDNDSVSDVTNFCMSHYREDSRIIKIAASKKKIA